MFRLLFKCWLMIVREVHNLEHIVKKIEHIV